VTPIELPFEQIWAVDTEFVSKPGEHPAVVCLIARELRSGQTFRLWRDQLGALPPYRIDAGALFVCFVANAELACHLALGWPLPAKVLDLSPVFRRVVNGRIAPEGKGLLGALAYYGIGSIGAKRKDDMRKRIMQGWPFTAEEREQILSYCAHDVDALALLLPKLLADPDFELDLALHWGEFVSVSASTEHRGVPIDMEIFPSLQDKKAWAYVRDALVPTIDAQYGVYVKGKDGEWSFSVALFEALLIRLGIDWPRLDSGKLNLRRKTFENMCKAWPELEELRQLRYARDKMRRVKLSVGRDGRNRTVLWPFQAKTSRTQPKASQWIFSPAVWLRSLIKPGPGRAVAYIDYSAMGVGALRFRRSISRFCKMRWRTSQLGNEADARERARAVQSHASGDAIRHVRRNVGAAAGRLYLCRARNAQPASWAVQSILGLVGGLGCARVRYRDHAHVFWMDVSHRHH
jgi:DNA polymerase I